MDQSMGSWRLLYTLAAKSPILHIEQLLLLHLLVIDPLPTLHMNKVMSSLGFLSHMTMDKIIGDAW
jgi:hypothetical protein